MSRLSDLILQAKKENPQLGAAIEREVRHLQERRSFGLNFERHQPESVDLFGRPVRRGDKVRMLPPRGETNSPDTRSWTVTGSKDIDGVRVAELTDKRTKETAEFPIDDLVVVAESKDTIYPGLVSTAKVEMGGDKPFHTVINAENLHALKALLYTHRGKIDCIYIDPPYNTGARDWKYNNNYVDSEDMYRHSKWLAFMERRLLIARELLNSEDSVLIATIDEKEYLRLGILLEQVFLGASIQMVSSVINPKGTGRANEMLRVTEFIFIVRLGQSLVGTFQATDQEEEPIAWETMRRRNLASKRGRKGKGACGPNQFYPIYVNRANGEIESIGLPLPESMPISEAPERLGCAAVFPIRPDGTEMNWSLKSDACLNRWRRGYVRAGKRDPGKPQEYVIQFLPAGAIAAIENGDAEITARNTDGSIEAIYATEKERTPTTQWNIRAHNAEHNGTNLLKQIVPGRDFPFPKSLYAVEDVLQLFLGDKMRATILDFFAGSGTTAHAVMRLNRRDGGRRQCISVTNNEVAADQQLVLRRSGLRPADSDWEKHGIHERVTQARIRAVIEGSTPDGVPIEGEYRFNDEFPLQEGLNENAEFFKLTYETPLKIATNQAFDRIAPLLWLRAGSRGRRIETLDDGWDVSEGYGVIADFDLVGDFLRGLDTSPDVTYAFAVTDDERQFTSLCSALPDRIEPVRLYESYLRNFQIDAARSSR